MIRASKINVYIRLLERMGIGAKRLLAGTGIDSATLAVPDAPVGRESYSIAIMNLLQLTNDPGVAFSLGEVIELSDFGILGYAMLSSTTLDQVVRIRRQYHNTIFGTMISIHSARDLRPGYELTVSSSAFTDVLRRFEIEEFLVEGIALVRILTGVQPEIRSVSFAYPEPSYSARYKAFFKCPVDFGAPATVFNVKSPGLSVPILSGNAELHKICARHCQEVMRIERDSSPLQARLRELFLNAPGNLPELPEVATQMGMSDRSLRRKLKDEGLSFQALKDEFRLDLSRQLLIAGMTPKEVAYLLGYSTPSVLSRAFKLWTGKTIQQFLQVNQQEAAA